MALFRMILDHTIDDQQTDRIGIAVNYCSGALKDTQYLLRGANEDTNYRQLAVNFKGQRDVLVTETS